MVTELLKNLEICEAFRARLDVRTWHTRLLKLVHRLHRYRRDHGLPGDPTACTSPTEPDIDPV
jgi:hypothetical protein